jgi:hypothetical protein
MKSEQLLWFAAGVLVGVIVVPKIRAKMGA